MTLALKDRFKEFIRDYVLTIFSLLSSLFIKYEKKDIAIMRMDEIGDFIIWLACMPHIKSHYKNRKITLICNAFNAEIAKKYDWFDEIIVCKLSAFDLFCKLYNKNFKLFIQPMYSRNPTVEFASALIKSNHKIAIDGDCMNSPLQYKSKYNNNYTILVKTTETVIPELKRNFIFLEKLLRKQFKMHTLDLSVFYANKPLNKDYFVINLGARCNFRRWYANRFYEVAEYLHNNFGLTCVLIGNCNEKTISDEFFIKSKIPTINMVGKTTLSEMINIVYWAKYVFCNDTSTVHIAAACQTKCFCIGNGLVYNRFPYYPKEINNSFLPEIIANVRNCYGCNLGIKGKEMLPDCKRLHNEDKIVPCVSNISSEQVINRFNEYLANLKN